MGRRRFLGASDASSIWGSSGWSSPYSCWWSKVGPFEPSDGDIIQRIGHAMEPLITELFHEATGVEVYDPGDFAVFLNPECKVMGCTPDRLTTDGTAIVELKTASFGAAEEWKTHIPLGYQCQLQHSMICCGVERAYIAVLINSTSFKWHEMFLHESFRKRHMLKCLAFWREFVETETAPPADYSKATSQALCRQWQDSKPTAVELPDSFRGLGVRYDKLSRVAAAVDRHKEEIKNRVKAELCDNQLGKLPDEDGGFSWKGSNGRRVFTRKETIRDDN